MKKSMGSLLIVAVCTQCLFYACQKSGSSEKEGAANTEVVASPSLSTVGVISDWETGNASQWHGVVARASSQWAVDSAPNIPVRQGKYAVRLLVQPGDVVPNTSGERCEPNHYNDTWNNYSQETLGDEFYYGWSNYFPTTWTNPTGWGIIFQFHHSNPINPPLAINVQNDTIALIMRSGYTEVSGTNFSNRTYAFNHYEKFLNTINRGKWNDFIMRVKFRPDWTGIVEIWHKTQTQSTFTKVLSLTSIPTMQWTTHPDLFEPAFEFTYNGTWLTSPVYLRNGLYRGSGGTNTNALFQDNFARGTTFADIAARF